MHKLNVTYLFVWKEYFQIEQLTNKKEYSQKGKNIKLNIYK